MWPLRISISVSSRICWTKKNPLPACIRGLRYMPNQSKHSRCSWTTAGTSTIDGTLIPCPQSGLVSVSVRWKPGLTLAPISEAIRLNNLELVKWFLAHGATPRLDSTEFTYRTPLTDAVNYASIDIVKLLVAHGAEVNHGNLLHELCESSCPSRLEILDYLISQGAPVNQFEEASNPRLSECSNQFGIGTPLHNAAKCNNLAMAKALLSHGADPRLQDNRCWTPLGWAKTLGEARMIELLEEACPNASWYCSSASENRPSASEIRLSASENQSSASEYLLGSSDDWSSASD